MLSGFRKDFDKSWTAQGNAGGNSQGDPPKIPGQTGNAGEHMVPKQHPNDAGFDFPFRPGWEVMYDGTTSLQGWSPGRTWWLPQVQNGADARRLR